MPCRVCIQILDHTFACDDKLVRHGIASVWVCLVDASNPPPNGKFVKFHRSLVCRTPDAPPIVGDYDPGIARDSHPPCQRLAHCSIGDLVWILVRISNKLRPCNRVHHGEDVEDSSVQDLTKLSGLFQLGEVCLVVG